MEFESLESISTWSIYEVAHFVSELVGTDIYSKVLKDNDVNGKALLHCKLEGWKQYGIQKLAHRAALYGWVQGRISSYQEKVNMQRRISMESSNRACHKQLRKPNEIEKPPNNKLIERDDKYKKIPAKAILKESYGSQSRILHDNMRKLREWFKDGAGRFSRHEFLTGNLKKKTDLKAAILEVIEKRKQELKDLIVDGEKCAWSTEEIFAKVLTHRNYLKKVKHEVNLEKSCGGEEDLGTKPSEEYVYVPIMEEANDVDFQVNDQSMMEDMSHNVPTTTTLRDISLYVSMFGSPFYISDQVIQFREERLVARKAIIQYQFSQEFDEGMIGFGGSNFIQKLLDGPYERWEVEVTDLAIGIGMKTLLLPGTRRAASTVKVGERLILPAVYLLMSESLPDSDINRTECDQLKEGSKGEEGTKYGSGLQEFISQVLDESSNNDEDQRSNSEQDEGKAVLECSNDYEDKVLNFQHNQHKEVGDNIDGNDLAMGLMASKVMSDFDLGNVILEVTNTSTMGNPNHAKPGMITEKLLQKYYSIDMNSSLARRATVCTQEAFKKKEDELGDAKSLEVKSCHEFESDVEMDGAAAKEKKFLSLNSNLVQAGLKKRANTRDRGRNVKKVLKDVTNNMLGSPKRMAIKDTPKSMEGERLKQPKSKNVLVWKLSDYKREKSECPLNSHLAGENIMDPTMFTEEDKEAIAMKLLQENDVDCTYGQLPSHLKRIQEENSVHFVDIERSTSKIIMLDTLVFWAIACKKVFVNQVMGFEVTQDVIFLS